MDDSLEVTGGAGGTAADLVALMGGASALTQAGGHLVDAGQEVARAGADPALLAGALVDPAGYAAVQQSLVPLAAHLPLEGARVTALGHGVRAAAIAYAATEAANEWLVVEARDALAAQAGKLVLRAAASPYGWALLAVPVAGWITYRGYPLLFEEHRRLWADVARGRFSPRSIDDRVLRMERGHLEALLADARAAGPAASFWAASHPEASQHLVGALPALLDGFSGPTALPRALNGQAALGWPPTTVEELALLLSVAGAVALPRVGLGADVTRVGPSVTTSAPTGVRDLLGRAVPYTPPTEPTVTATPSAYEPARIRVDRLDGARGTSWVVTIPPTQNWSVTGSRNPFDVSSNVHLMAGLPASSSRAAVDAMQAAGVRPGQPVMLVGYSQGGLTALQLASDPIVRQRVDVTSVLTAGSPTAGFAVPDDVAVLSLEHRQDLVVAADGEDNPDDPAWTTVRRDLLSGTGADARVATELPQRPWAAHHLTPYLGTAAMVDSSSDESVQVWMRSSAPFWAAPGTTATTTEFVATRE